MNSIIECELFESFAFRFVLHCYDEVLMNSIIEWIPLPHRGIVLVSVSDTS